MQLRGGALLLSLLASSVSLVGQTPQVPPENPLAPLRWFADLAGACWTGTDGSGRTTDRQCYSVQYGRFLRGTVEIHGGSATGKPAYEGEGLFAWDAKKERMAYFFWASAGHFGQAEGYFEGDRLVFPPANEGQTGAAPVRSIWTRVDERSFEVVREKKSDQGWAPMLTVRYRRD